MTYHVDRGFSVYDLVDWQNVSNIFIEKRPMLAFYCKRIESELVEQQVPAQVYAGFQRLMRVKPVLPRYREIASVGASISLFGMADENDPALPEFRSVVVRNYDQLLKEWFLVANHPRMQRALIAREVGDPTLPHKDRTFQGVLTSDPEQIQHLAQRIEAAVSRD